jgi:hypothetical protein
MKHIKLAVVLCLCSSAVFAETTLEILQQRAVAGDAAAQTFLGMAYQYGYGVDVQKEKAVEWFSRAAAQGDKYAAMRQNLLNGASKSPGFGAINLRVATFADFQEEINQASYEGSVGFDNLAVSREQYLGKVIELTFITLTTIGGPTGNSYIYVRDPKSYGNQGGSSDKLYLLGDEAMRWKLDVDKKAPGSSSTVYALVEKDGLVALGDRKRKTDDGYTYSW